MFVWLYNDTFRIGNDGRTMASEYMSEVNCVRGHSVLLFQKRDEQMKPNVLLKELINLKR